MLDFIVKLGGSVLTNKAVEEAARPDAIEENVNILSESFKAGNKFVVLHGVGFFSFVAIYLVGGFVIQRFFRGARGADQIPNVEFWKELGSLIADGCDLVCRCGRERDSYLDDRGHRGRSEGLLENASDHVDIDDGLLGM